MMLALGGVLGTSQERIGGEASDGFREQVISASLVPQRKRWTHVCFEGRGWGENHKAFTRCPRACEQGGGDLNHHLALLPYIP